MKTRYYSLTRAARELDVHSAAVVAMCNSGCLPRLVRRYVQNYGEMTLVNAEAVDALAALSRREESAA